MSSISIRLLAVLAYSAQFEYPLSLEEIKLRLIAIDAAERFYQLLLLLADTQTTELKNLQPQSPIFSKIDYHPLIVHSSDLQDLMTQKLSLEECLIELAKLGLVEHENDYWLLAAVVKNFAEKNGAAQLAKRRHKRAQRSLALIEELKPLIQFAQSCRWVKAIGVTGSAAVKNAAGDADADLMIVTQSNRLWLTRWLLLAWVLLHGKKCWPWQNGQDEWCLNLFLEEDSLLLPNSKQGIYFAYEACQIDWIYDEHDFKTKFYVENAWVADYLPQWHTRLTKIQAGLDLDGDVMGSGLARKKHQNQEKKWFFGLSSWMNWLNLLAFKLQTKHLHRKNQIPLYNLKLKQAFLHGRDLAAGWE